MKRIGILALLAISLLSRLLIACLGRRADGNDSAASSPEASPDGIGKFHMGREISKVMGHEGIDWLERDNHEEEEAPSRGIAALELEPDDFIADIGAGSGYHTFRMAPLASN
jgi:hypothetical protein